MTASRDRRGLITCRSRLRFAIKILHLELSSHPEIRSRFLREGYVANKIEHSAAVSVSDDDVTEDGAVFLVMDLLEGETVEARSARSGGILPIGEILSIAYQLLDVLEARARASAEPTEPLVTPAASTGTVLSIDDLPAKRLVLGGK